MYEEHLGVSSGERGGKKSVLQQRVQTETAGFDFSTLLQEAAPVHPALPSLELPENAFPTARLGDPAPRAWQGDACPSPAHPVQSHESRGRGRPYALGVTLGIVGVALIGAGSLRRLHARSASPLPSPPLVSVAPSLASGLQETPLPPEAKTFAGASTAMGGRAAALPSPEVSTPQRATGVMPLQMARTLVGPFSYWFVAASEQASAPQALPAPDAHGWVNLTLPAAYNHPGAQVRLLDQSLGKVARLPVQDFSRPALVANPQVGADVLAPSSNSPSQGWMLEQSERGQGALQMRDGLEGPVSASGSVMHLEVTTLSTQNWHVQCYRQGISLEHGKRYQLAFWARADRSRALDVNVMLDQPDWRMVGLAGRVQVTSCWQKYTLPFTAQRSIPHHTRLTFLLGNALGTLDLAAVSLRPGGEDVVIRPQAHTGAVRVTLADFH